MNKYPNFPPEAFGKWANTTATPQETPRAHNPIAFAHTPAFRACQNLREGTSKHPTTPMDRERSTQPQIQPEINDKQQLQKFLIDLSEENTNEPWPRDFRVPDDEEEMDQMVENMAANGIQASEAKMIIASGKIEFETALKQYNILKKENQKHSF
jgi:hypothetical protein